MIAFLWLVSHGTPIKYAETLGNSWGLKDAQNQSWEINRPLWNSGRLSRTGEDLGGWYTLKEDTNQGRRGNCFKDWLWKIFKGLPLCLLVKV